MRTCQKVERERSILLCVLKSFTKHRTTAKNVLKCVLHVQNLFLLIKPVVFLTFPTPLPSSSSLRKLSNNLSGVEIGYYGTFNYSLIHVVTLKSPPTFNVLSTLRPKTRVVAQWKLLTFLNTRFFKAPNLILNYLSENMCYRTELEILWWSLF